MAEVFRVGLREVKQLVSLVGGLVKDLAPEELRPLVKVTNGSSASKFLLRATFNGDGFFVAETYGRSFKIPAGGKDVELRYGLTRDAKAAIKAFVKEILEARYARLQANWHLNAPLRNIPGVRATQEDGGYVRLEFDALTPQAYKRMIDVLVPLMHVPRYDREEPV